MKLGCRMLAWLVQIPEFRGLRVEFLPLRFIVLIFLLGDKVSAEN